MICITNFNIYWDIVELIYFHPGYSIIFVMFCRFDSIGRFEIVPSLLKGFNTFTHHFQPMIFFNPSRIEIERINI